MFLKQINRKINDLTIICNIHFLILLQPAIMCHSQKETDLQATCAEFVYGTTLTLPGEIFTSWTTSKTSCRSQLNRATTTSKHTSGKDLNMLPWPNHTKVYTELSEETSNHTQKKHNRSAQYSIPSVE